MPNDLKTKGLPATRCKAPCMLNLPIKQRQMVSFMLWLIHPRKTYPNNHVMAGWEAPRQRIIPASARTFRS